MDIVTLSGIRKELLLYLDEGPQSLSDIKDRFDITSPEVSPRIKELLEHNLVIYEGKKYHLTPMGKTIVKNFRPFVDTLNVFDQCPEWWEEHDISSIPDELLYRIGELKSFVIIEDNPSDMSRTKTELFKLINRSKSVKGVSCGFEETLPDLCVNTVKNNIPMTIVLTDHVYDLFKKHFPTQLGEFISNANGTIYVSKDQIKVSHALTNDCLFFSLCYKNGKFDVNSNLVSNNPSSIKWGNDLFEYYRDRAVKIN